MAKNSKSVEENIPVVPEESTEVKENPESSAGVETTTEETTEVVVVPGGSEESDETSEGSEEAGTTIEETTEVVVVPEGSAESGETSEGSEVAGTTVEETTEAGESLEAQARQLMADKRVGMVWYCSKQKYWFVNRDYAYQYAKSKNVTLKIFERDEMEISRA